MVLAPLFTTASSTTHQQKIQVLEEVKSRLWASCDSLELEEVYTMNYGV